MTVSLGMPAPPAPTLAPRRKTRQLQVGRVGVGSEHPVSVRDEHRRRGIEVLEIVDRAVEAGALPQSPRSGACDWCDFRGVCGPLEATRTARKRSTLGALEDLDALRGLP